MYIPGPRQKYEDGNTSNFNVQDGFVSFTEKFKYLGSIIHYSITPDADIESRIKSASKAFGAASKSFFTNRSIGEKTRGGIFIALCLPILIYGCECWNARDSNLKKLSSFYNRCVRQICRVSIRTVLRRKITTSKLLQQLGIKSFEFYYRKRLLRWVGHVARMDMKRLPRKFLTGWVEHKRPIGGPTMTFGRTVKKALKQATISTDFKSWSKTAQSRTEWRKRIKHE